MTSRLLLYFCCRRRLPNSQCPTLCSLPATFPTQGLSARQMQGGDNIYCVDFFFNETRSLLTKTSTSPPAPPLTAPLAHLPVSEELKQSRHGTAATTGGGAGLQLGAFTG